MDPLSILWLTNIRFSSTSSRKESIKRVSCKSIQAPKNELKNKTHLNLHKQPTLDQSRSSLSPALKILSLQHRRISFSTVKDSWQQTQQFRVSLPLRRRESRARDLRRRILSLNLLQTISQPTSFQRWMASYKCRTVQSKWSQATVPVPPRSTSSRAPTKQVVRTSPSRQWIVVNPTQTQRRTTAIQSFRCSRPSLPRTRANYGIKSHTRTCQWLNPLASQSVT